MSEAEPKPEMTRLGSYAIIRKLAKGGMAELFLARSLGPEGFEKLVVLKKILPRYAENPRFVQLFLDEAKLAASLDHPHIVHVYDMGRVDGNYFFTMEYVHGQDVRTILRTASRDKRELPISIAVQIARTVASALHHAHERREADGALRNIVHRDVSPSNILVSYDGAIKLADFGVAKASSSSVRTRTGALKGKVGYMSPEQARGASIDRRSDIFSLGVVLWELVTMRRLFKSDNDLATIQAIINTPPPSLVDLRPDCPPELDRIARKALSKEPATRYDNAQQLQRDLDELSRELKLDQSSIVVGTFMSEVFAADIAAMRTARDAGNSVAEIISSGVATTTPVSESELSLEDPGDEPADVEEPGADEEEEISEQTALPALSGSIERDRDDEALDEATEFGSPPSMDTVVTTAPKPAPKLPPQPAIRIIPVPELPPRPTPDSPEDPFEIVATKLRMNPMRDGDPFEAASTTVASPAFTDDAPTVTASPDIVKHAFAESAETVQASPSYESHAGRKAEVADRALARLEDHLGTRPSLTDPDQNLAFDTTAVAFEPSDPPSEPPTTRSPRSEVATKPIPFHEPGRQPHLGYSAQALSPSVAVMPQTPPAGVPSMPGMQAPRTGMPTDGIALGAPAYDPNRQMPVSYPVQANVQMPGMQSHAPMGALRYPTLSQQHDDHHVNLVPHRRWLVIGGVAVVVAVTAIIMVVLLSGGGGSNESNDETAPDAADVRPVVTPDAANATTNSGSARAPTPAGSAMPGADAGSAGFVVMPPPPPKVSKPPIRKPPPRRTR